MRINAEFIAYKIQLSYLKIRCKFWTFGWLLFRVIFNEKTFYKNLSI